MQDHWNPEELGRALREGSNPFLRRRRSIIGLAFFSSAMLGGIALYQMGVLKRLPMPPWRVFDAEKVNGSPEAYSMLHTPDALLGLMSYAVTACLAGMGPENRSQTHPLMPIGMGLKLLADTAFAGKLTVDECRKYQALSLWSLLTAVATWTDFPLAIPETVAALRKLRGRQHA